MRRRDGIPHKNRPGSVRSGAIDFGPGSVHEERAEPLEPFPLQEPVLQGGQRRGLQFRGGGCFNGVKVRERPARQLPGRPVGRLHGRFQKAPAPLPDLPEPERAPQVSPRPQERQPPHSTPPSRINQHQERQDKQGASGEGAVERLQRMMPSRTSPQVCTNAATNASGVGCKAESGAGVRRGTADRCSLRRRGGRGNQEDCQQEEKPRLPRAERFSTP